MSARPPGIGVVGCGTIARGQHFGNLARMRRARLVAAADPDPAARAAVERRWRLPVTASAAELVARADVDAVVLAGPTELHAEHALLAIEHGKPFYLEKPLAADAEDARRVLAAARARGVPGCVGFNYRRQPVFAELRRRVAVGELGELLAARTVFTEPLPGAREGWRARRSSGGGVWLDLGSHHADLLRWLTGEEIVAAAGGAIASLAGEQDRASARFTLAGGAEAQVLLAYGAGPVDRIELYGRRAVAIADRHAGGLRLVAPRRFGYGARSRAAGGSGIGLLRLRRRLQPSWEPSFARSLRAFVEAVSAGSLAALPSLEDGAASLAAVLAAERSARDGITVPVERLAAGDGAG